MLFTRLFLTSVNDNAITYDTSGNPLTYYNGMSFTWQDGRKLASLTGTGISASYVYNGDGLRTQKTVTEGTEQYTVEYFYEGNKLIALERIQGTTTDYMFFLYDQSDNIVGFELNGTAYYYSKNLQGDVLSILDSNGDVVVKYTYTAWGELVSAKDNNGNTITDTTSVAYLNPIRYRGYVYDDEIGMYYLQSRYYDPSIGRFINADSAEYIGASGTILGSNLFAYCENNSVNCYDFDGKLTIVIDPGHGGRDLGAKRIIGFGMYAKYYFEKNFNLRVAKEVYRLLVRSGFYVLMTRNDDSTVSLSKRYNFANIFKADIFVSIHHNSSNSFKNGFSVLYTGKHDIYCSQRLAKSIDAGLNRYTKLKRYKFPQKNTSLAVLNGTKMPAVLVECGYMGGDLNYCLNNYAKIAYAIYTGIVRYIRI